MFSDLLESKVNTAHDGDELLMKPVGAFSLLILCLYVTSQSPQIKAWNELININYFVMRLYGHSDDPWQ